MKVIKWEDIEKIAKEKRALAGDSKDINSSFLRGDAAALLELEKYVIEIEGKELCGN